MGWTSYIIGTAIAGGFLSISLVVVGVLRRRRVQEEIRSADPVIDDDDVERILASGVLVKEDAPPLDLDEIAEEEERFWESESWDGAEEF